MKRDTFVRVALASVAFFLAGVALRPFLRARAATPRPRDNFDYVDVWSDPMFLLPVADSRSQSALILFDSSDGSIWAYQYDAIFGGRAPLYVGKLTKLGAPIEQPGISLGPTPSLAIQQPDQARRRAAKLQIASFKRALDGFYIDAGCYPGRNQGHKALLHRPKDSDIAADWRGPYLSRIPKDPWGRDYVYRRPGVGGADFDIICYGKDGVEGGEGVDRDITNHNLDER